MLATQLGEELGVADGPWISQLSLYVGGARSRVGKTIAETQFVLPYFCRKRSTRPAVSTSFCFPVKKGWQAEQMSVCISALVERVSNVLPHAHTTVAVAYSGWISLFTIGLVYNVLSSC